MIIIHNTTGLLWGLAGLGSGLVVALMTGHPGWGLLTLSIVWMAMGWGKVVVGKPTLPGQPPPLPIRRPAPSIFFIPLRIWGVIALLLALPSLFMKLPSTSADDPRRPSLDADLAGLSADAKSGDDIGLSTKIQLLVARMTKKLPEDREFRVRTRLKEDRALVLVTVADLRRISDVGRTDLLDEIESFVLLERPDVRHVYIGIQGLVLFGAVRTPDRTDVGKAVLDENLLDFYERPSTRPSTQRME